MPLRRHAWDIGVSRTPIHPNGALSPTDRLWGSAAIWQPACGSAGTVQFIEFASERKSVSPCLQTVWSRQTCCPGKRPRRLSQNLPLPSRADSGPTSGVPRLRRHLDRSFLPSSCLTPHPRPQSRQVSGSLPACPGQTRSTAGAPCGCQHLDGSPAGREDCCLLSQN